MGPLRPGGGRDLPLLSVYVWRGVVVAAARCGGGRRQSGGVVVVAVVVVVVGGGQRWAAVVGPGRRWGWPAGLFFLFFENPFTEGDPTCSRRRALHRWNSAVRPSPRASSR
jgi:hypothetical protein